MKSVFLHPELRAVRTAATRTKRTFLRLDELSRAGRPRVAFQTIAGPLQEGLNRHHYGHAGGRLANWFGKRNTKRLYNMAEFMRTNETGKADRVARKLVWELLNGHYDWKDHGYHQFGMGYATAAAELMAGAEIMGYPVSRMAEIIIGYFYNKSQMYSPTGVEAVLAGYLGLTGDVKRAVELTLEAAHHSLVNPEQAVKLTAYAVESAELTIRNDPAGLAYFNMKAIYGMGEAAPYINWISLTQLSQIGDITYGRMLAAIEEHLDLERAATALIMIPISFSDNTETGWKTIPLTAEGMQKAMESKGIDPIRAAMIIQKARGNAGALLSRGTNPNTLSTLEFMGAAPWKSSKVVFVPKGDPRQLELPFETGLEPKP